MRQVTTQTIVFYLIYSGVRNTFRQVKQNKEI